MQKPMVMVLSSIDVNAFHAERFDGDFLDLSIPMGLELDMAQVVLMALGLWRTSRDSLSRSLVYVFLRHICSAFSLCLDGLRDI